MITALVVMVVLAAVVVGLVLYRVGVIRRPMAPEEFAEAVRHKIASDHPNVTVKQANGFEFILVINGEECPAYLDNTYARYRLSPQHFDEIVGGFLKAITQRRDTELSWDEAKPKLYPALKPQQFLDDTRKLKGGAALVDELVVTDYRANLRILIAVDSDLTMSFVTKPMLAKWHVTADEALKVSIENLAKLTAPYWAEATERAREYGFFAFNTQDGYDASRLLLPDFYERASRALGCTRIAVGVPNREYVVAVNADDKQRVAHQRQKAREDFAAYDHAISPELLFLPE